LCCLLARDLIDRKGRARQEELQLTAFGFFVIILCFGREAKSHRCQLCLRQLTTPLTTTLGNGRVFYGNGTDDSFGVCAFFLVGVRICTRANNTERKREEPWFAFGSCFLGGGSSRSHLPIMPTLDTNYTYCCKNRDSVCVVLWLGNLFTQKVEERDKSCGQHHFDLSFCVSVQREAKRLA